MGLIARTLMCLWFLVMTPPLTGLAQDVNKPSPALVGSQAADARIPDNTILHLGHSANLIKIDGKVLIFDYPFGSSTFADILYKLDPNDLKSENVYVFVSHNHGDHFNSKIFSWKDHIRRIKYIVSATVARRPEGATVVVPGQVIQIDDVHIRTYPSSDSGVAFLVYVAGRHIYFAGDNGFWNWENNRSEEDYVLEDLSFIDDTTPIDIAFQVCDPKADGKGQGGIGAFALTFQPRLLVPLHLRGDYEFPKKVEPQLKQRGFTGRFWVVTAPGDSIACDDLPPVSVSRRSAGSLGEAAALGDTQQVRTHLSSGANVNAQNENGRTPLHLAAGLGGKEVTEMLLAGGADVSARDKNGRTPLHLAARAHKTDVVELLVKSGVDISARCGKGYTPLYTAVAAGARIVVEVLIDAGADVNAKSGEINWTAIHIAAGIGDSALARLLIAHGAKTDARTVQGYTPLSLAAEAGHGDIVELLINAGADVNAKDSDGRTPLHCAALAGSLGVADRLITSGADVNTADHRGHTPLNLALVGARTEMAELLIARGADIHTTDDSGYTPLHWVVTLGNEDMSQLLLSKGADVNARDKKGLTPLSIATEKGHERIAELLRKHGAM